MNTILVNGCFDILHPGHIKLLFYARMHGDRLVVAIDSDERVAKNKPGRPICNEEHRAFMLKSTGLVDDVKVFNSEHQLKRIARDINPLAMVVGSDWKGKEIIGSEYAQLGVLFYDRDPNYSTTALIDKIKNS